MHEAAEGKVGELGGKKRESTGVVIFRPHVSDGFADDDTPVSHLTRFEAGRRRLEITLSPDHHPSPSSIIQSHSRCYESCAACLPVAVPEFHIVILTPRLKVIVVDGPPLEQTCGDFARCPTEVVRFCTCFFFLSRERRYFLLDLLQTSHLWPMCRERPMPENELGEW